MKKEVVLITGGSGFFAQHLLKELQTKCSDDIDEIRLYDREEFRKFLDFPENIRQTTIKADCLNEEALLKALKGCTTVFHLAAKRYDFNLFADKDAYKRDNVVVTRELLKAMTAQSVPKLIYAADAMANLEPEPHVGIAEELCMGEPKRWISGEHGRTKFAAEQLVIKQNGAKLENQEALTTISIRHMCLYGEGDSWFVPQALRQAQYFSGVLPETGTHMAGYFLWTYVGNAAAALVQAWRKLSAEPERFGGEVVYCTDVNGMWYYDFIRPFIDAAGYQISKLHINYWLSVYLLKSVEVVLKGLNAVGIRRGEGLPNSDWVMMLGEFSYGSSIRKQRLFLEFIAPHSNEDAMKTTIDWWKKELAENKAKYAIAASK